MARVERHVIQDRGEFCGLGRHRATDGQVERHAVVYGRVHVSGKRHIEGLAAIPNDQAFARVQGDLRLVPLAEIECVDSQSTPGPLTIEIVWRDHLAWTIFQGVKPK